MLTPPCSHSLRIDAVTMRQRALTRKMIADRLVMWRVKLKISPASSAGRISGRVTLRKVYCASPPRMLDASSMDGIDLLQRRHAGAHRGGQAAHDKGGQDDVRRADQRQRLAHEAERSDQGQQLAIARRCSGAALPRSASAMITSTIGTYRRWPVSGGGVWKKTLM